MSIKRIQNFVLRGTRKDRHELYIRPIHPQQAIEFRAGTPHPELSEAEARICG
ncbi:hypothetical protein K2Y00_01670 [Patescibacteria group bacterium]|nr:hypothetical protein [Patescibacteria group bacterium]